MRMCMCRYVQLCDLYSFPTRRSSDLCPECIALHTSGAMIIRRPALIWQRPPWTAPCASNRMLAKSTLRWRITTTTAFVTRSEEHTSELQSPDHLVCRLLPDKKNDAVDICVCVCAATYSSVTYTLSLHDALPIFVQSA